MRYRTAALLMLVTAGCTSAGVAQPVSSRQSGPIVAPTPAAIAIPTTTTGTTTHTRRRKPGGTCRPWTYRAAH